ncbi:probable protein S-acyltransferase 7 isoform X2 [Musa acuminata AAA Group]|uniref:probable protein S-acyltransferase 7 isoform X2 n=1 Tax=Musa acuminata AAA Group TaxID=214697 RepID=UPI0031CEA689
MHVGPPPRGSDLAARGMAADAESPRVFEAWKGSNIFFLQGRFIFGPDVRSLFLTIFLIVAPVSIFCVFVARKLMDEFSSTLGIPVMVIAVLFTLYDLILLLVTSGRDPGIVPRNPHPPEAEIFEDNSEVGGARTAQLHLPRTKDVNVNGMTVKRNYRFFYMFVFSTTLLCLYVFGFSWVCIVKIRNAEQISLWRAMTKTPASIVLIIYIFISVWFVGGLSVFHLYLMSTNQTTYENFRYRYDRRANPYNRGVVENFKEIFFTSIPPSKNKFRARVPREQEYQQLTIGGGFMSPNMGRAVGDIEMGRKPVTWDELRAVTQAGDLEGGLSSRNMVDDKDSELGEVSPDLRREFLSTRGVEVQAALHHRRSSWGRGGSWETMPEVRAVASAMWETSRIGSGSGSRSMSAANL